MTAKRRLGCRSCGHEAAYSVPQLVDWRDREALELLKRCVPVLACEACDEPVLLDSPVVVLRPADPIAVLVGFPAGTAVEDDAAILKDLLRHPGVPAEPAEGSAFVPVGLAELGNISGRYTGFALARLRLEPPEDWSDPELDWLRAIRDMVAIPDLAQEIRDFLTGANEADAIQIAQRSGGLLDPAWEPVVEEFLARTTAEQTDPDAAEAVRQRSLVLRRLKMGSTAVINDAALTTQAVELLDEAIRGPDRFAETRIAALTRLVEDLRDQEDATVAFVAALISHAATVSSAPSHTADDLEAAFRSAEEAVSLAPAIFGPGHEITRRAKQDYAALLLDRRHGNPAENERAAMDLFTEVARSSVRDSDRGLADILLNWAAALSHHTVGGRIDNQVDAMRLHYDALHVQRVLRPLDRRSEIRIKVNLAAALRERRTDNIAESTREAVRIYQEVLTDPGTLGLLSPEEACQIAANMVTAKYQLHELQPEEMPSIEVLEAARDSVPLCEACAEGIPERIRALANVGGVLTDLQREPGLADATAASVVDLALRLAETAYREAGQQLPPGHGERLRVGINYAAALSAAAASEADHARAGAVLEELLAIADPDRQPAYRNVIAANLGRWRCQRSLWEQAASAFEIALDAVQRLYRDARTRASGLAELGEAADLAGWLVGAHMARSDTVKSVEAVEASRSRLLWDSFSGTSTSAGPPSELAVYQRPVLYVGTGPLLSWILLVRPGSPEPTGVRIQFNARELRPYVRDFRRARTRDEVMNALDVLTDVLGGAILTPVRLLIETAGIADVDVVSSGLLSGLPLHAMANEGDPCWLDHAVVRYVPSGRLAQLRQLSGPPRVGPAPVLAVAGQQADLDCARHEPALIPRRLGPHLPVPADGNRSRWLLNEMHDVGFAHFACHARWDPDDPLRSYIDLGGSHRITLGELLELSLPDLRLAVMSCCSAGVPVERWADELVGFGTGMMIAGADSVVTSNWDLPDLPSSLLMARFYQLIGSDAEPAAALRDAQLWVRQLTVADIAEFVDEALDEVAGAMLPGGLAAEAERVLWDDNAPDSRPFRHPVHWAGFSYHGIAAHNLGLAPAEQEKAT
jgi:CHAT domain-containing protein